jgi:putative CocE/NonD family hydrolase
MSDRDDSGNAWLVSPTEYLERRPPTYATPPAPSSCYVTMRDGCRLAVDTYLPQSAGKPDAQARFPTIVILTPYYRRFKVTGPGADPSPNAAKYRDFFVPRGYAMVVVDVRGCGASFGTRDSFRSPRERDDHREIADWIVAQPWSDGVIGSTGISYLGAAACFLASTGHPAVKAIAPLFAVSDTYSDHVFPGGIMCTTITANYDDLVRALDLDQRDRLGPYPYFNDPRFAGPQPVDEDVDGSLVRAAVEEHRNSFRLRDLAGELAFREEPTPHDPDLHSGACSPYWYLPAVAGKVAIYSVSGWYDGSAFVNGSISRFLTNGNPNDRLLLGPWDHGARTNGSPWRGTSQEPEFPLLGEVLRFFDEHLAGMKTGIADEARIHYHTVQGETWQAASQWPLLEAGTKWFMHSSGGLSRAAPKEEAHADYQVRFTTGTGASTRFERLGALAVADYYHDWNGREEQMLGFTTAPFESDIELAGHAIVQLHVSTSEHDASIFVYLSEVDAEGRSWYITEGALRMLHRATTDAPANYRTTWPFRTFRRADARRMQPGVPETLRFALLPISWLLKRGHRLRISIAGTDADHFAQVPHGRPPKLQFTLGGADASFIELPMKWPAR